MKKFLMQTCRCCLFIGGLALLLLVASKLVTPKSFGTKDSSIQDAMANAIMDEPEQTIDLLILGDSETYSSMIPLQLWKDYGITGYNCGTPAQNLGYSMDFLKKAFQKQTPKVVILETNAIYRDFSYAEAVKYKMDRKFSIFSYHNRWKSFSKKAGQTSVYADNTKGYVFSDAIAAADAGEYMKLTSEKETISAKSLTYLDDIAAFCKKKNAKLVLVSTPSVVNWNYRRHNSVQEVANRLGVEYIDMNVLTENIPINWDTDTRDHGDHLNYSGAYKVTSYLGEMLSGWEVLPDHRFDQKYTAWDDCLVLFEELTGTSSGENIVVSAK